MKLNGGNTRLNGHLWYGWEIFRTNAVSHSLHFDLNSYLAAPSFFQHFHYCRI